MGVVRIYRMRARNPSRWNAMYADKRTVCLGGHQHVCDARFQHAWVCVRCAKARFKLVLSVGHPTRQNSQCGRAVSCMNYV